MAATTTLEIVSKELFEKSLKGFYESNDVKIYGFSSKAAVATGENYTSDLFRVNVTFGRNNDDKKECISLIVKVQPIGNEMEVLTTEMKLFVKEMEMFGKTLPMMYDILGPQLKGCLSSHCLYTTDKPHSVLVLEDLQPAGFIMAPRQLGLDLEHCKLVMQKIAIFHAASVVLVDKNPTTIVNYNHGMYSENAMLAPWMHKGMESMTESFLSTPGLEKYGIKLQKLGEEAIKRGIEAGNRRLGGFNVLNHGDLWMNNMLFSYNTDGTLKDLKFVDFQIVRYTSPALDLQYFLSTSTNTEVRQKHMETLLNVYYGHLLATLSDLEYCLDSVPSRADFLKDFNLRGFYGIMACATVAPLVRAPFRKDATFEDLMKEDGPGSFRHECYTNKNYTSYMEQIMPQYEALGLFN